MLMVANNACQFVWYRPPDLAMILEDFQDKTRKEIGIWRLSTLNKKIVNTLQNSLVSHFLTSSFGGVAHKTIEIKN
jgi:hypothetical protein